jgi:hypothetical protein
MMETKLEKSKVPFTALGLIFGTVLGAGVALLLSVPIFWAGAGTGVGLVVGAAIDGYQKKREK